MSGEHFVVIGSGPAGNQAALTLREKAPEARITLISKNLGGSCRAHRIPDFIAGKIREEALYAVTPRAYKEKNIKFRHGQEAVALNLEAGTVTLDHKEVLSFTGLIIAVGGKPRIPEGLLAFEDLMLTLKTVEDARAWIQRLSRVDSVLLIGGDLTSFAVTKALLHLGKKVYFMLNRHAFWPLRPHQELFDEATESLAGKGVEVLASPKWKGLSRSSENSFRVRLDDRVLEVGMIGAFYGLVPDIRFLAGSGLRIDRGVLVDEYLHTGFDGVFATGDCAQIYHPGIRDYWVSIGHENALALGRTAALNLLGGRVRAEAAKESIFEVEGIRVNSSWWTEF